VITADGFKKVLMRDVVTAQLNQGTEFKNPTTCPYDVRILTVDNEDDFPSYNAQFSSSNSGIRSSRIASVASLSDSFQTECAHARHLLSFMRIALLPPAGRGMQLTRDHRVSSLANQALQNISRHSLLQKMMDGSLTSSEALVEYPISQFTKYVTIVPNTHQQHDLDIDKIRNSLIAAKDQALAALQQCDAFLNKTKSN
jgi:hypothetical protein